MVQNERGTGLVVPNLHGRSSASGPVSWASGPSVLFRAVAPLVLVGIGVGTTVAWASYLSWCLFSLLRWAVG